MDTPALPIPTLDLPEAAPLPEPSAHVVDAAPPDTNAAPTVENKTNPAPVYASNASTSPTGEVWNASIHETPPRLAVRSNTWARIRGFRAAQKPAPAPKISPSVAEPIHGPHEADAPHASDRVVDAIPVDYAALGLLAGTTSFSLLQVLVGEDGAPDKGELPALSDAFTNYFRSRQMPDIPPGWGLVLVAGSIIAKRVSKPTVRDRLRHMYISFMGFVRWMREPLKDG